MSMNRTNTNRYLSLAAAIAIGLGSAVGAQAQNTTTSTQADASSQTDTSTARGLNKQGELNETRRDVHQQERIDQGLKSGELTTKEASQLEKGEAQIDRTEQRDMANGSLSASERAQLQSMQNRESSEIYGQKHDAQTGNPDSKSSERMQQDVSRDTSEERRIHNGVRSGSLTNSETGRLEGHQASTDRGEARASANGNVSASEQQRIHHTQNYNSRHIWHRKHNDVVR